MAVQFQDEMGTQSRNSMEGIQETKLQSHKAMEGMREITDEVISVDILAAAKSIMRSYAWALSETASPKVREVLKSHFDAAVANHATITSYMIRKGYYEAYDPQKQYALDMQTTQKVMDLRS